MSAMSPLRPFTKIDWYGFAGCTSFADGSEPMLGERAAPVGWPEDLTEMGDAVLVIVDAEGLGLQGLNVDMYLNCSDKAEAVAIAEMLVAAPASLSYAVLVRLGFKSSME